MPRPSRFAVAVQEVIRRAVHPELAPLGFKKSHSTYRRTVGACIQSVNVQSSAFQVLNARFTINVGVDFPEAYKVGVGLLPSPGPAWVNIAQQRIGRLMPQPHDHWWEVAPEEPVGSLEAALRRGQPDDAQPMETVITEVRDAVRNLALPWLTRFSDPRVVLEHTRGRNAIVLTLMLGDVAQARRLAREHLRDVPNDDLAREWAQEHGLIK